MLAQTYETLGFQKSAREGWARAIEVCRDEKRKADMQVRPSCNSSGCRVSGPGGCASASADPLAAEGYCA
ncbi:MAG TPA: hypothetical protein VIW03_05655 [Anaeromyxobacter sp.]